MADQISMMKELEEGYAILESLEPEVMNIINPDNQIDFQELVNQKSGRSTTRNVMTSFCQSRKPSISNLLFEDQQNINGTKKLKKQRSKTSNFSQLQKHLETQRKPSWQQFLGTNRGGQMKSGQNQRGYGTDRPMFGAKGGSFQGIFGDGFGINTMAETQTQNEDIGAENQSNSRSQMQTTTMQRKPSIYQDYNELQEMANAMSTHYLNYMFDSNNRNPSENEDEEQLLSPNQDQGMKGDHQDDHFLYKRFAKKAMAMGKKALKENQDLKNENHFLQTQLQVMVKRFVKFKALYEEVHTRLNFNANLKTERQEIGTQTDDPQSSQSHRDEVVENLQSIYETDPSQKMFDQTQNPDVQNLGQFQDRQGDGYCEEEGIQQDQNKMLMMSTKPPLVQNSISQMNQQGPLYNSRPPQPTRTPFQNKRESYVIHQGNQNHLQGPVSFLAYSTPQPMNQHLIQHQPSFQVQANPLHPQNQDPEKFISDLQKRLETRVDKVCKENGGIKKELKKLKKKFFNSKYSKSKKNRSVRLSLEDFKKLRKEKRMRSQGNTSRMGQGISSQSKIPRRQRTCGRDGCGMPSHDKSSIHHHVNTSSQSKIFHKKKNLRYQNGGNGAKSNSRVHITSHHKRKKRALRKCNSRDRKLYSKSSKDSKSSSNTRRTVYKKLNSYMKQRNSPGGKRSSKQRQKEKASKTFHNPSKIPRGPPVSSHHTHRCQNKENENSFQMMCTCELKNGSQIQHHYFENGGSKNQRDLNQTICCHGQKRKGSRNLNMIESKRDGRFQKRANSTLGSKKQKRFTIQRHKKIR